MKQYLQHCQQSDDSNSSAYNLLQRSADCIATIPLDEQVAVTLTCRSHKRHYRFKQPLHSCQDRELEMPVPQLEHTLL